MRRCWCLKYWLLLDTGKDRKPDRMELLKESKTLYTGPSLLASGTWDIGRSFCPQGELLMYIQLCFNFFHLFQLATGCIVERWTQLWIAGTASTNGSELLTVTLLTRRNGDQDRTYLCTGAMLCNVPHQYWQKNRLIF